MSFSWGELSRIRCSSCCPGPVCNTFKEVRSSRHICPSKWKDIAAILKEKKKNNYKKNFSVLRNHVTSFKILLDNFHVNSW